MTDKKPTIDFKDTIYYKEYVSMIDSYSIKIIKNIISQQWIDNEHKYTRWDVLKEVLKFVNGEMKEFKELETLNPNRKIQEQEDIQRLVDEQAKSLWIIN